MPGRKARKQPMLDQPETTQTLQATAVPNTERRANNDYREHKPNPDHLLELWSISGTTFKTLLESLKAILNEANLVFTDKGLKLATVDTKQVALVHLFMDADAFEFYRCTEKLICGIDIDLLHRTMKSNTASDLMSFIIHKDERDVLEVTFENRQKGTKISDKISLISLPEYRIENTIEYESPPPLLCSHSFQKICRDMWCFGTTLMEIEIVSNKICFRSLDGSTRRTVTIDVFPSEEDGDNSASIQAPPAKGTFFLWYLKSFAKASNLSPSLRLYLRNDRPCIIEYNIHSFGVLKFALASVSPEVLEKAVVTRRTRGT